jgi:CRP-like cAMP-binding protein
MIQQTTTPLQGTDLSGLPATILARIQTSPREFLARVPLFRGLPEDQLDQLARMSEVQNFRRNAPIIRQGEPNRHIYFIKDGIVGVTVAGEEGEEERVVSYFHQNHIFGEFGVFSSEEHIATATVTALSEVNLLRIAHNDFTGMLTDYHPAAMEVARILTERLKAPTDRLVPLPQERNVFLVMGLNKGVGMTTVGSTLAAALAKQLNDEGREVVYTEYPDGHTLPATFNYAETEFYAHPEGFDLFVPRGMPRLAAVVNLELIVERLQKRYKNVIISLPAKLLYDVADIFQLVSKVVLVASPARWDSLQEIEDVLHVSPYLQEDSILSVVNYCLPDYAHLPKPEDADFVIPFLVGMNLADKHDGIPEQLRLLAGSMAGRLSSQNEVLVYMPATVTLPNGEQINTSPALEKLQWVFKDAFGNVQLSQLGEEAHIISSSASVSELNEKWRHVLQQVQNIKPAVRQEVLAVEINRNLVLV